MDINEKLHSLLKFIEEGIRRKIYYLHYFEFIHRTFIRLIETHLFNRKSFTGFIISTKGSVWKELLSNKEFRNKLEKFLIENPEVNKFVERLNMNFSIIITNLEYQFEFIDKCEDSEYNIEKCEDPLNRSIKEIGEELKQLFKFQRRLLEEMGKLELCYICKNYTLNQCIECGKCICERHSTFGYCPNCIKRILKERQKTT